MVFLNPTYLWALLGLVVPIAIHLWSKKEGKTIKIGSIQLLSEADSRQNSSIKLNELLLLLMRLLLIALVVLIMAEPQIKRDFENTKLTYLVEPSLIKNKTIATLVDTVKTEASFRLLQKGFPEFNLDDIPSLSETVPNYWQLAQEMDELHSDSIIVFTNGFLKGLKGKRPEINSNVDWIVLDKGEASEKIIKATKKDEEVELLTLVSNSQSLSFKNNRVSSSNVIELNETIDSIKIGNNWKVLEAVTPLKILIFNDANFSKEALYIDAAFKAISKYTNRPIEIRSLNNDSTNLDTTNFDCMIWLSKQEPLEVSGKLLVFKPDKFASSLIVEGPRSNVFHLTKFLNSEIIIDEHLPEQLINVLNLHSNLSNTILENDKRIIAKDELQLIYNTTETQKNYASVFNISNWLWMLLAGLLVLERIVANYRKQ